ncbi:hypothetical protein [Pseudoalteromonas sp. TAB23]|uniref:hypothetical protein n=1 Tax=Pseudoalteromonas sp. TAB23 TaxID=1938595 RepID=UPI000466F6FB|nr:hypothetical protein [Pseudoalteromonas sp. TAB23]
MGTEIVVLSYLTTPIIFFISIGMLFKTSFPNAKAVILLSVNTLFIGYFIIEGFISGYLLQAFLVGGFLLIPFHGIFNKTPILNFALFEFRG